MPRADRATQHKPVHRLADISRVEQQDNEQTSSIYRAVSRLFCSPGPEREKVSVRTKGGVIRTLSGVPLNTCADGAGKGWPRIYIVEIDKAQISICVWSREGNVLIPWNWDDLWGRVEFADKQKERLFRAELVHYVQGLLKLRYPQLFD